MNDVPTAIRGLVLEIVGGAVVIAYLFVGIATVVAVFTVIDHGKKAIKKLVSK